MSRILTVDQENEFTLGEPDVHAVCSSVANGCLSTSDLFHSRTQETHDRIAGKNTLGEHGK